MPRGLELQTSRSAVQPAISEQITPFALLVALLTSYRVNNAHSKWERANLMAMGLHENTRLFVSRLCTTFEHSPANAERLLRIRRLMIAG